MPGSPVLIFGIVRARFVHNALPSRDAIIMGVTGLMIWFKMDVTHWLPRWAVDVALTIHYYEAILACLAIIVWHFYHVIFDPDVYPLNMACWDGRVSEHWQKEEHPLDVQFKSSKVTETNIGSSVPALSVAQQKMTSSGTNPVNVGK